MITPTTIVMGAAMAMVQAMTTSICTCCTSLVMRVMSDGAPKAPTSRAEKSVTRWNRAARMSRPKPIATRAPDAHRRDGEDHLDQREHDHQGAARADEGRVAGEHALVDDLSVERREGEGGGDLHALEAHEQDEIALVGPEVGAEQTGQHDGLGLTPLRNNAAIFFGGIGSSVIIGWHVDSASARR